MDIPEAENDLRSGILACLKKGKATHLGLCEFLDLRPSESHRLDAELVAMRDAGISIQQSGDTWYIAHDLPIGGSSAIEAPTRHDNWKVFGVVSDTHLGSKHCRLDALKTMYQVFADEGVKDVYLPGNYIDGEFRLNKHELLVHGMDAQLNYFVENFPQVEGITTRFIAGDDHEGWYIQRESVDIGRVTEDVARRAGRNDLQYLGYVEYDILFPVASGHSAVLRVSHGGGGATYAFSYVLQKVVESYQGGEKPDILAMGHHHKFDYCYPRNVHAFMPGCFEDQTVFMRKRKIEAHVGGVIVYFQQDEKDGHITRCRVEWVPFYDKGYYQRRFTVGSVPGGPALVR